MVIIDTEAKKHLVEAAAELAMFSRLIDSGKTHLAAVNHNCARGIGETSKNNEIVSYKDQLRLEAIAVLMLELQRVSLQLETPILRDWVQEGDQYVNDSSVVM